MNIDAVQMFVQFVNEKKALDLKVCYQGLSSNTVNPLYTDTRYNDKICYNDNLTVTKPLLKMCQLMRNYPRVLH